MASAQQAIDSLRQAGGGASQASRATPTIDDTARSYLKHIFATHADRDGKWTAGQIRRFICQVQANDDSTPAASHILSQHDVDFAAFLQYMTSEDSNVTLPCQASDLSWPLSSYFISSSHNTYLSGNQLYSDSTTDAYTNVLLRGCRCVEIDVWDGDSDISASSASSSDSEDTKADRKLHPRRSGTFGKLRKRIPESLVARFEKTNLGHASEPGHPGKQVSQQNTTPSIGHDEGKAVPEVAVTEPRVLHGYTLTKEISFRDVCVAIRESAFTVTDLPLIISLEVHCGPEQQKMMADIMKETWAGMLVSQDEIQPGTLPSPSELRRKILIKVKYTSPEALLLRGGEGAKKDDGSPTEAAAPKKPSKILQALSKLGVYTQAVSFKAWTQPEASMPTHIFSLAEKKFLDHREKHGKALFDHNKQFLLRAYPSGLRIRSSNMIPTLFWASGAQIVALNWQASDKGMMLNEGMFAGTGGYVLKPAGWRPGIASKPIPNAAKVQTLSLTITFLAAQAIPLPPGDKSDRSFNPYVKTELHIDASDPRAGQEMSDEIRDSDIRHKARTKTHKGSNIDLGRQKMSFHDVEGVVEELTFVRFTIRDDELGIDDLAAWACVRLDRLGQGYRFIHLMDSKGQLSEGTILVKVEKKLVDGIAPLPPPPPLPPAGGV